MPKRYENPEQEKKSSKHSHRLRILGYKIFWKRVSKRTDHKTPNTNTEENIVWTGTCSDLVD